MQLFVLLVLSPSNILCGLKSFDLKEILFLATLKFLETKETTLLVISLRDSGLPTQTTRLLNIFRGKKGYEIRFRFVETIPRVHQLGGLSDKWKSINS